jgi:hypothetical protein
VIPDCGRESPNQRGVKGLSLLPFEAFMTAHPIWRCGSRSLMQDSTWPGWIDFWPDAIWRPQLGFFGFKLATSISTWLAWCSNMKGENSTQFRYRVNSDGTIDSICLRCFLTAARVENEADLHAREAAHLCDRSGDASGVVSAITRLSKAGKD